MVLHPPERGNTRLKTKAVKGSQGLQGFVTRWVAVPFDYARPRVRQIPLGTNSENQESQGFQVSTSSRPPDIRTNTGKAMGSPARNRS
jgi:hypothetical protein